MIFSVKESTKEFIQETLPVLCSMFNKYYLLLITCMGRRTFFILISKVKMMVCKVSLQRYICKS